MTKKRFIKLLMSYGIQRNNAQQIARDVNGRNIPYKQACPAVIISYKASRCILALAQCCREFAEQIKSALIPAWDKLKEAVNSSARLSLPCPDYGQTPKTTTKPYIKPITKSRSRERKQ